jgi:hypothetical protein
MIIGQIIRNSVMSLDTDRFPCNFVMMDFSRNVYVSQAMKTIFHKFRTCGGTGDWDSYKTYEPIPNKWEVNIDGVVDPLFTCKSEDRAISRAKLVVKENWQSLLKTIPASKKDVDYLNNNLYS